MIISLAFSSTFSKSLSRILSSSFLRLSTLTSMFSLTYEAAFSTLTLHSIWFSSRKNKQRKKQQKNKFYSYIFVILKHFLPSDSLIVFSKSSFMVSKSSLSFILTTHLWARSSLPTVTLPCFLHVTRSPTLHLLQMQWPQLSRIGSWQMKRKPSSHTAHLPLLSLAQLCSTAHSIESTIVSKRMRRINSFKTILNSLFYLVFCSFFFNFLGYAVE